MIDENPMGAALDRNPASGSAPGEAVERRLDAFVEGRANGKVKLPGDKGVQGGDAVRMLKAEYAEAMPRGGLEGKVQAHAVLKVAE
jgi:hypothetical protein